MAEAQSHKAFPKETTLSKQNIITKGRSAQVWDFFPTLARIYFRPKAITEASAGKADGEEGFETSGYIKLDTVMNASCFENVFLFKSRPCA